MTAGTDRLRPQRRLRASNLGDRVFRVGHAAVRAGACSSSSACWWWYEFARASCRPCTGSAGASSPTSTWDPVHDIFGAWPFIFGTLVSSPARAADRGADQSGRGHLPRRTRSAPGCATRSRSWSSCWPRCPASSTDCGGSSCSCRCCGRWRPGWGSTWAFVWPNLSLPGHALRHGHAGGRADPRHHDPADHHRGLAGSAARRAAHAAGGRLRARARRAGRRSAGRCSATPAPASSAPSSSGWAGRWGRRWP